MIPRQSRLFDSGSRAAAVRRRCHPSKTLYLTVGLAVAREPKGSAQPSLGPASCRQPLVSRNGEFVGTVL
ncbi:hypothetical protein GCM10020219_066780 [Nonomuraea dietziae]